MEDITVKDKGTAAGKYDSQQERVTEHALEDINLNSNVSTVLH